MKSTARPAHIAALSLSLGLLLGCGGSCGTDVGPVPGGFDADLRIARAAQVRLTAGGLQSLSQTISDEVRSGLSLSCASDSDCPAGFWQGAQTITPSCQRGRCVEAGAQAGPYVSVPSPSGGQGTVQLCPSGASPCRSVARFGSAVLAPRAGAGLSATLDLQLSADVSLRDTSSGADCVLQVRAPSAPNPVVADIDVGVHPSNGALTVGVQPLPFSVPSASLSVVPDPVSGTAEDSALCAQIDVAQLPTLYADLGPSLQALLARPFGDRCSTSAQCPTDSSCDTQAGLCVQDGTGHALSDPLAYDTRLQLPALLGDLGYRGTSGQVDTAVAVGGQVDIDSSGMALGIQAGFETATPNPVCATITPSPVTRSGYQPPPGMPATAQADLDFDGTLETDYDVAFAASQDFLRQVAWGMYTSGLLCGVITHREFDGLTTGALELIIPSVRFLARSHLFERSEAPARLSVYARSEPEVVLGTGQTQMSGGDQVWTEPLMRLDLKDVEINLSMLMDERWVRIMTITLDVHVGIGALVTPNNAIEPVLGVGVPDLVSNVRVSNSELLAEPPASLETSIPTLLSLLVLELSGSQGEVELPELPGLDLTVLGLRGEDGPAGAKESLVVYANAQPSTQQGNLHASVQTQASLIKVQTPPTEAFSVLRQGGPQLPTVQIAVQGRWPTDAIIEHQVRVDGGPWGPFFIGPTRVLQHPAFLLQGPHQVEARSRVRGAYKTLDASPAVVDFVIDSVAPELEAWVLPNEGTLRVDVWDRIGPVQLVLHHGSQRRVLEVQDDLPMALPEWSGDQRLAVVATDAGGNRSEVVLRQAVMAPAAPEPQVASGCSSTQGTSMWAWWVLVPLWARRRLTSSRRRSERLP